MVVIVLSLINDLGMIYCIDQMYCDKRNHLIAVVLIEIIAIL